MQNVPVNSLSRHFVIDHKWELHNKVLYNILAQWRNPAGNLFASQTNSRSATTAPEEPSVTSLGRCSPSLLVRPTELCLPSTTTPPSGAAQNRQSPQFLTALAERMKGLPVSSQHISSWITSCIRTCYGLAEIPVPPLTAHSTRVQASSAAFLALVLIQDICKAVTWSSIHTFMLHYAITQQVRDDAAFSQAALQSATQ